MLTWLRQALVGQGLLKFTSPVRSNDGGQGDDGGPQFLSWKLALLCLCRGDIDQCSEESISVIHLKKPIFKTNQMEHIKETYFILKVIAPKSKGLLPGLTTAGRRLQGVIGCGS